jgi:hypothetical protein
MNRKRLLSPARLGCLVLMLTPAVGWASLVLFHDVKDLVDRSDRVLVAEVLSVDAAWDKDHKRIYTSIELQVAEMWKGAMPPTRRLKIVQPGGSVGDIEMRVHGMPSFTAGERAVLFLRGTDTATVVGMAQGKRSLLRSAAGVWLVAPADLSGVVTLDQGGRPAATPPQTAAPLDLLREQIRTLVKHLDEAGPRDDRVRARGKP